MPSRASIAPAILGLLILLLIFIFSGCGGGGDKEGSGVSGAVATGADFDRAFIDAMVPHHESAVDMAWEAKRAGLTQRDLKKVADDIIDTQQAEIAQMKSWREEWFGSAEIDPDGAAALGLSNDEMGMAHDASAIAEAPDPDAAFASMMIDHHEGAIAMAELADERADRSEIKSLARAIIEAQEREIEVLEPHASGVHHGG